MARDTVVVYGLHSVRAALESAPEQLAEVLLDRGRDDRRLQELAALCATYGVPVQRVPAARLDALAEGARHQGVVASQRGGGALTEDELEGLLDALDGPPLLLVLDGVQDPHNLGACLRTADAVGAHAVIAPRDRACGLTPVVRKVASGAAESVPFVQVTNLARTLRALAARGIWIVGAAGEADASLFQADLRGPLALVLGAEGAGLRRLTREHCDLLIRIPMAGRVESLNVSVAAGVCLFEAARQRTAP
ncbi:23S rRNA (guanosine(2251)-2'-O)-methyltransferase RlmB [Ectothiorhodospiraceae bacterium 2226]|nr:23S rRNA (guanosine(2251)-2'-O)-methyltransferase RlmB [Ectothiorhodospiraceae bacterium 2226]